MSTSSMNPLGMLDDFVITPGIQTAKGAQSGFSSILNYFTLWIVALTGLITVYVVMPLVNKAPANMIIMLCVVALGVGIFMHANQFGAEYRLSTWQNNLQFYGSIVMLFAVIILAMGAYYYNTDPSVKSATDSMVNRGLSTVTSSTQGLRNSVTSRLPSFGNYGFGGGGNNNANLE